MAHGIEIKNGSASMFYVQEVPWHGLGVKLDQPATAAEAIAHARMDWSVRKAPLLAQPDIDVPDRFAIVRNDTQHVLGVVGADYQPLQNKEAFSFFDPIVGADAAVYHTAGVLGEGEKIWILAKLPGYLRVTGDDVSEKYLLLSNGHDGKTSVQIKFTPVRVVCQNTLHLALNSGKTLRVAHHSDLKEKLRDVEKALGIINNRFGDLEASFQAMAQLPMDTEKLGVYLERVFPLPETDELAPIETTMRERSWSAYFFEEGHGNRLPGVRGSLWAALNGVTEWVDHRQSQRGPSALARSSMFGRGQQVKSRAYAVALDFLRN